MEYVEREVFAPVTSIERTAYPHFRRAPSVKELRDIFTPILTDVTFVATRAHGLAQKFALMILLKVYQRSKRRRNQRVSYHSKSLVYMRKQGRSMLGALTVVFLGSPFVIAWAPKWLLLFLYS